jgi:hypothetical protein
MEIEGDGFELSFETAVNDFHHAKPRENLQKLVDLLFPENNR